MLKDYFAVGIQLANLKAPADKIFHFIELGLKENEENCQLIYMWYNMYDQFRNNLVNADTALFLASVQYCRDILGSESYQSFEREEKQKVQASQNDLRLSDSTKMNSELVSMLQEIYENDQNLRLRLSPSNQENAASNAIWTEIKTADSLNLIKIETLLNTQGYPSFHEVGRALHKVPWLVLHHQSDIVTRLQYDSILAEGVGDEMMKGYRMRTQELKLSQEN